MTVAAVFLRQRAVCPCGWVSYLPELSINGSAISGQWTTLELQGHRGRCDQVTRPDPWVTPMYVVGLTTAIRRNAIANAAITPSFNSAKPHLLWISVLGVVIPGRSLFFPRDAFARFRGEGRGT